MRAARALLLILSVLCSAQSAQAQSYTVMPSPFQTAFSNAGVIISNACIWTYLAGTSTAATTYSDNVATPNLNPIRSDSAGRFTAYLVVGVSYKFVYESSCTPPAHGTVLRTADNISAVPSAAANVDVTGIAGETITAGLCAYLSDGSGSKVAGLWYKCDSSNTYSSTAAEVGLAPSAITVSTAGTIRLAGAVTGLAGLSVGSEYFVSTGGALTTTAPANRRHLGHADTTTSMVLTADPQPATPTGAVGLVLTGQGSGVAASFLSVGYPNDFRLSLTTAVCETVSDVTAAGTLFLTPCDGNRITLFDSSGNPEICAITEKSIAVPANTSQMFDVWAFDSSFGTCAVSLELLAWTNDTTRATAIARSGGRWTKSGDTTRMYLGSFRTTAVANQTEDSVTKRYVWNYYNRRKRQLLRQETTSNWAYTTATIRQANGSTANQVDTVVGVAESMLDLSVYISVGNNAAASATKVGIGIGEGSTTTFSSAQIGGGGIVEPDTTVQGSTTVTAWLTKYPAVGRQFWSWNEWSAASGTSTWHGTDMGTTGNVAGMRGWIEG